MTPRHLDQFYTKPAVASLCFEKMHQFLSDHPMRIEGWIEPSAGTGSFFSLLPEPKTGLDLEPKAPGLLTQDFLTFTPVYPSHVGQYVTIGNPPFGRNAMLAMRFLNHAATFSKVIGFILPRSFKKQSMIRRVHPYLHLMTEFEIPPYSFLFNGSEHDVPCVFQIWMKHPDKRVDPAPCLTHPDFEFTTFDQAQIAFQRVGRHAGTIKLASNLLSTSSHYFIKAKPSVVLRLKTLDWPEKSCTSGCPSISKQEIVERYASFAKTT